MAILNATGFHDPTALRLSVNSSAKRQCVWCDMTVKSMTSLHAGRVFIHPGSVNFDIGKFESGWLVYTDMVATAKLYVRESSMVPVYALLLFGGKLEAVL